MTTAGFDPNPGNTPGAGLITSSTPAPMVGPVGVGKDRPYTSSTLQTSSQSDLIKQYGKMSDAARKSLAAKLKAAGFRVPITGAYNEKVRSAFLDAHSALSDEINTLKNNDPARLAQVPYNLDMFLDNLAEGTGGAGGPSVYQQSTISSPSAVAATLDKLAADLLGRQLSPQEKAKYTSMLQTEQKKPSSVATTTTTKKGGGVTSAVSTGGLNAEQFLIEKLAATDEAKAQKVLDAYTAVNKLFGGLQ